MMMKKYAYMIPLRVYNTRVLSAQEVMQIYNYELQ